jgi:putative copper export protein
VLSPTAATVRLLLHVLAATVWVGGQITLAGLVPGLKQISSDAPRTVARRFNRIAWPAFGVLVLTGIWNMFDVEIGEQSTEYQVTFFVKLVVVAVSGIAAWWHSTAKTKASLAIGGALTALSALAAVYLGLLLMTGAA